MTPPSLKTRLLGHPAILLPSTLLTLLLLYAAYRQGDPVGWGLTLAPMAALNAMFGANETMVRYKAWKRAWDGMAPGGADRPARNWRPWVGSAIVALTVAYFVATPDAPGHPFALAWMAAVAVLGGILLAVRRWRSGRPQRDAVVLVRIGVARPLMAVPSLATAYRSLPPHCLALLQPQRSPDGRPARQ